MVFEPMGGKIFRSYPKEANDVTPCDWLELYIYVCVCYQSLTAHQHQKGHTVPKQV